MIILPTLRYGDAAYGSTSLTTLKTLDPVHHISTLTEMREQETAKIAIRVITNESYLIRSYFMTNTQTNQEHSNQYSLEQLNTWINYRYT
jgi:hypothetical protein